jgi:hypothetical protein
LARRPRKSGVVRVLLGKRKLQQNFLFMAAIRWREWYGEESN